MSEKCEGSAVIDGETHRCALGAGELHDEHQAWVAERWQFWTNEAYVAPVDSMKRMRDLSAQSIAERMPVRRRESTELAGAHDPRTSKRAAVDVSDRAANWRPDSQNTSVLLAFAQAGAEGLTARQAGEATGLTRFPDCCWWHRVSDNKKFGFIESSGQERQSATTKLDREVLVITSEGAAYARELAARGGRVWYSPRGSAEEES